MNENLIDKESQVKINFLKTQAERAFYLDEFKENVALALTEEQLRSGIVYPEIIERIKQSDVAYIKMKRENINPNNYHRFENEVISIKIEVKNKSFY